VNRLTSEPGFAKVVVFKVDFDSSKDVLRAWRVQQQSTLIAFKGRAETMRSVGVTDPDGIRTIFQAAL
jgi:thioredoxin 1